MKLTTHVEWTVWTIGRSENSLPYRDSNSDPLVVQPVASRYTDCTTATHEQAQERTHFVQHLLKFPTLSK
jgi:hypothetical protein